MEFSPLSLIYSHIPARGVEDGMWWRVKKSGLFDIRSFYNVLQNPSSVVLLPWRSIWCSNAPQRVCFFVWSSAWDKILTCDNLMRRGYNMTSWCCMCGCSGDSGLSPFALLYGTSFVEFCGVLCFVPLELSGLYPSRWWIWLAEWIMEILF